MRWQDRAPDPINPGTISEGGKTTISSRESAGLTPNRLVQLVILKLEGAAITDRGTERQRERGKEGKMD
jgi:hypothetical protein